MTYVLGLAIILNCVTMNVFAYKRYYGLTLASMVLTITCIGLLLG